MSLKCKTHIQLDVRLIWQNLCSSRQAEQEKIEKKLRQTIDDFNRERAKLEKVSKLEDFLNFKKKFKEGSEAKEKATDLARENKLLQDELKNALKAQTEMEKSLYKSQVFPFY